ncbi:MAG: ABC transporter substrate-binding protein [Deltaproteobacteria bacterium]|nr:ABC transporter substrate-binding protein [Deltaproteobacteria bacterium]
MAGRISRIRQIGWIVGVLFPLIAGVSAHGAQTSEKVRLAIPAKSMGYLPMYVAIHRGFMRDEGLELEIPNLRPNIAHSALLGGEIEYHGLAESGLRLAAKGSPMKSLFFSLRSPLYFLMAKPQIKTLQDLKGKIIGISSFGGATEVSTRIGLRHHGLDPDRDVTMILIGTENVRVAALSSGSIDATIAVPPSHVILRQKGFNLLLSLADVTDLPANGFTTLDRTLRDKREQVKRLLRGLSRGLAFAKERPKETIEIMAREWEIERAVAEEVYGPVSRALSKDGLASDAGLKEHFQIIQRLDKGIGEIPIPKVVDFQPLNEARRELGLR